MFEIISGLFNTSKVNFAFLLMNACLSVFYISLIFKKKIYSYLIFELFILFALYYKLFFVNTNDPSVHINIVSIISFPIILQAFPLYNIIAKKNKYISRYLSFVIFFYILDLPGISLFSSLLIPQYSLHILYVAGLLNIISLAAFTSENKKIRTKGLILFIITYIPAFFSLSKWMFLIIICSPVLLIFITSKRKEIKGKTNVFFIKYLLIGILVIFFSIDFIAQKAGYTSFNEYVLIRVTKNEVFDNTNIEQNKFFGLADGNRFNIYKTTITDYVKKDIIFGLNLDYINKYNMPTHNFLIFYLSFLGILGLYYIYMILFVLLKKNHNNYKDRVYRFISYLYIAFIIATFSVGESYSSPILLTFVLFNLSIIKNNTFAYG